MKPNRIPAIVAGLLLAVTLSLPVATFTGCALFGGVAEGSRPEVLRAEQFAKISFATADAFMEYEHTYRNTLGSDVQQFARTLEKNFPPAYASLRAATKTYKAFPSTDNLDGLQKARNVLQLIYDQLLLYAPSDVEARAAVTAKTIKLD